MGQAHWHTFQILTKRHERLAELASSLPWHPNVWMGVSIAVPRRPASSDRRELILAAG
jgi:protein gp37